MTRLLALAFFTAVLVVLCGIGVLVAFLKGAHRLDEDES